MIQMQQTSECLASWADCEAVPVHTRAAGKALEETEHQHALTLAVQELWALIMDAGTTYTNMLKQATLANTNML